MNQDRLDRPRSEGVRQTRSSSGIELENFLENLCITLYGARFSRKDRRSSDAIRVTVAVATNEERSVPDAAFTVTDGD